MNNVQENLKENITKVFEKLREEGMKGLLINESKSYPIQNTENNKSPSYIKDYNDYMRLIQVLDRLINMSINQNCRGNLIEEFKFLEEIELIQNTMNNSLDKCFVKQYDCLVKCYDSLLRIRRQLGFENKQYNKTIIISDDYDKCLDILKSNFKNYIQKTQYMYVCDNTTIYLLFNNCSQDFRGKRFDEIYIDKNCSEGFKTIYYNFYTKNSEFNLKECKVYEV